MKQHKWCPFLGATVAVVAGLLLTTSVATAQTTKPTTAADSLRALLRIRAAALNSPPATTPAHAPGASASPSTTKKSAATSAPALKKRVVPPAPPAERAPSVVTRAQENEHANEHASAQPADHAPEMSSPVKPDSTFIAVADSVANSIVAPSTSAPTNAVPPAPAVVPAPRIAEVGFGTLKFDGLMQMQYAASNTKTANTFRIRRAELKIAGKVSPKVSWSMMFDVSKSLSLNSTSTTVEGSKVVTDASINQSSRLMQDAMLTLELTRTLRVDAGQFRLPLGGVGSSGSSTLETIERPMFQSDRGRGGALGDVRDVGFVVRGAARGVAEYWVGAFNGSGESMNTVDANNQKSVVARVTFRTPVTGLRVGASGLSSGFAVGSPARKDRIGGEAVYAHNAYLLRAEVQDGKDGMIDRLGGFLLFGVRTSRNVQIVTRLDAWDPDTRADGTVAAARTTDLMGGATWFLAGDNAKLQFNVSHRWYSNNIAAPINQVLLNLQASW